MADKLRIHQLAKELGVNSKAILEKCTAEGVDVKNHMSTVSAGLAATIREWFSEHEDVGTAAETAERVNLEKLRKATKRTRRTTKAVAKAADSDDKAVEEPKPKKPVVKHSTKAAAKKKTEQDPGHEAAATKPPPVKKPAEAPAAPEDAPQKREKPPKPERAVAEDSPPIEKEEPPKPPVPAGPQNVPEPAKLTGPRVIRVESPEPPSRRGGAPARHASPEPPATPETGRSGKRARSKTYQGVEDEGQDRKRTSRRKSRGSDSGEHLREWRDQDLAERRERLRGATGRRAKRRASEGGGPIVQRVVTHAELFEPIILKDFCSATGLSLSQITPRLINDFKLLPNLNTVLEKETAVLVAAEFDIELSVKRAPSPLDRIREQFEKRDRPQLATRAPIVTFLGHVDHGKTSLLDAIRDSRVTQSEAGGITQHMGSYYLERNGRSVTFLDTPGHEAFTAMRARGAQLTDVVVLVVAADDGIMPQTVEAINHARAANVPIVVALNKIDLPGVDLNKIYGQLAEHELTPAEWGGTTDVIKTSATQKTGIDELIDHLATLSELLDLKADPTIPARGRVIESEMKSGVGPVARVLVQEGTLRTGDIIVCGPSFGKVRSMKNDQGQDLAEAGPAMPIEISGLDELPGAGDELYQVQSSRQAEEIAREVKQQRRRDALIRFKKPTSLEDLFTHRESGQIPELNVIIKADAQGSADVLQKSLAELPSGEVKLNILHAGVGGIVESDILLAEASGAIIIGFQVVADTAVRRMAEDKQVDIRLYRVIYNVIDDIKKALEGLLKPEVRLEPRGLAEVREVFKVSRIGTVAGCFVRDGVFARNYKARIIRDSVIVRDGASIDSLRRFKDDVKEVKTGYECGIKIAGFDDLKPGDQIEAYEAVEIARTL